MKVTQFPTRRQINSNILAYLPEPEASSILQQYLPPTGLAEAKSWGTAFCDSMTPTSGPEAWRDYQLYFACVASDLHGLADTMQNHAELETEAEFRLIVMISHLSNFMNELCAFHNSIWSRYLAKEVWDKERPVEPLIEMTIGLIEELEHKQNVVLEHLQDWESLINQETTQSISCKEFIVSFPFAAGFAKVFCRNAAAMLQDACQRQQALRGRPNPRPLSEVKNNSDSIH